MRFCLVKGKLVSIIIPTYNGEKFIEKTLCAVIEQDYEDLEIILVNDGSTDNTLRISEEILKKSGRVFMIINHEKNRGVSSARNDGFNASHGEYVCFCDSDDWPQKNFVSELYKEIEDKKADLVFCGFEYFNPKGNDYKTGMLLEKSLGTPEDYLCEWSKNKLELWSIWNYIFNKDLLNKIKFPEDLNRNEDIEFIFKAIALSSRMSSVNKILFTYVDHEIHQSLIFTSDRPHHKDFVQEKTAGLRAARCIIRNIKNKRIKNYALKEFIADRILTQCKLTARAGDREYYDRIIKTLRHKKIREVMLCSTAKFFLWRPDWFFKCLMLIYAPGLYYRRYSSRKKK